MLNNKNILAALISALAIFGFFSFILPKYNNIQEARTILQGRKASFDERSNIVAKISALNEVYKKNQSIINTLGSILPTDKHHDEIVSSIFSIASQAGVVLSEATVSEVSYQQANPTKQTNIGVQGSGQYERIYNFLQLLEQSLRLYDVQNISLGVKEGTSGGTSASTLTFEIKINANSIN